MDAVRSLLFTLRGAAGNPPPLHGKVALVTGAGRGAHLLSAAQPPTTMRTATVQRGFSSVPTRPRHSLEVCCWPAGLGKVVARELALAGAHVFVAGRHGDNCVG